jgi:hypothetical protein
MLYPQSFAYLSSSTSFHPSNINPSRVNIQAPTIDVYPFQLFLLICSSLCISTIAMVFSAIILGVSPYLYVFPPVFALTILYHFVILIVSNGESAGSLRIFSLANVIATVILSVFWIAAGGLAVAVNVLIGQGKLGTSRGSWSAIIPCICAFIEAIIIGTICFYTRRERNRILYTDKWKWRAGQGAGGSSSQWRCVFSVVCLFLDTCLTLSLTVSPIDLST